MMKTAETLARVYIITSIIKRNNEVANYTLSKKSIVGFGCKSNNILENKVNIKMIRYDKKEIVL